MSKEAYDIYFERKGFNNKAIDDVFKVAKVEVYREIDIIVEKHKMILYYNEHKKFPKFDKYNLPDILMDRQAIIFLEALRGAAIYLFDVGDWMGMAPMHLRDNYVNNLLKQMIQIYQ